MITKEDIKNIADVEGTSVKEKNRLHQLNILFRQFDPLDLAEELDELLSDLFLFNAEFDPEGHGGMTSKCVNNHFHNIKFLKDFLLGVHEFETELQMKDKNLLEDLKQHGLID